MLSSIHIVSQKQIVGLWREAAVLEQSQQVVILTVNVTANFDGCLEFEEDGLSDKDFSSSSAQEFDFVLGEVDGLSRSVSSDCHECRTSIGCVTGRSDKTKFSTRTFEESINDRVQVYVVGSVSHVLLMRL